MDITATVRTWEVPSMRGQGLTYLVRLNQSGDYACSCPQFTSRCAPKGEGAYCKHIELVAAEGLRRHHRFSRHPIQGARLREALEGADGRR